MKIIDYYAELIELSAQFLEMHNYRRSGKSGIFYKYNLDKSRGWIIGFRKSSYNSPEFCKFMIKFGSICTSELRNFGVYRDKIRLEDLKFMVMDGYSLCDYSHEIDDFVVEIQNVNDYYQYIILPELKKIINQQSSGCDD